jgi:hypothetical protein
LSYEYGVSFESIVELSPMAFKAHIQVLKDIAKEQRDANKIARRHRPS